VSNSRDEARAVVDALERALQSLGNDLHDRLCQTLAGTGILLETVVRTAEGGKPIPMERLQKLRTSLEDATSEMRFLSRQLNPVQLDGHGLILLIHELIEHRKDRVEATLVCEKPVSIQNSRLALALYRAVHDVYVDILAQSQPQKIVISISREGDMIVLQIQNNEPVGPAAEKIIRTRMLAIGGELTLSPCPTGGTDLICRAPDSSPGEAVS
jgi:signal transduction histidine kinase